MDEDRAGKEVWAHFSGHRPWPERKLFGEKILWEADGISIEGEKKYIDTMILEWDLANSSGLSTPGHNEDKREAGGDEELRPRLTTAFRRSAAMANYMAQDRPDISFASKEVSRGMPCPTRLDTVKLKRMIRYSVSYTHLTLPTNLRV